MMVGAASAQSFAHERHHKSNTMLPDPMTPMLMFPMDKFCKSLLGQKHTPAARFLSLPVADGKLAN